MSQFTIVKDTNANANLLATFDMPSLKARGELRYVGNLPISANTVPNKLFIVNTSVGTTALQPIVCELQVNSDMTFTASTTTVSTVLGQT